MTAAIGLWGKHLFYCDVDHLIQHVDSNAVALWDELHVTFREFVYQGRGNADGAINQRLGHANIQTILPLKFSYANAASVSSLSRVLEVCVVPKYFLSQRECEKLLRRDRTRPLHQVLKAAVIARLSALAESKCSMLKQSIGKN